MINEKRIIAMTRMASYEANEGKKHMEISQYFRSDYISLNLLKGLISGTLAFVIMAAMMMVYDIDIFMKDIYKTDLVPKCKEIAFAYVVFICIYSVVCYVVATIRYNRARQGLKRYYMGLRSLSKYYEQKGNTDV